MTVTFARLLFVDCKRRFAKMVSLRLMLSLAQLSQAWLFKAVHL